MLPAGRGRSCDQSPRFAAHCREIYRATVDTFLRARNVERRRETIPRIPLCVPTKRGRVDPDPGHPK